MQELLPYIFAILAGIFTTFEAGINAKLGRLVTPKIATLHSLITGVMVILIANLLRGSIKEYNKVFSVSPHWLIGGVFGACIIYLVTKTIPELGITITLTLVVAAQILSSFYIDAFILKQEQISIMKMLGAVLVIMGVFFIVE